MKNIVLVLAMVGFLVGCGTVVPLPKTAACLKQAEDVGEAVYVDMEMGVIVQLSDAERMEITQAARNECWWAKGDRKN